eukprot:1517224-Rhodomonas_salina.3
MQATIPSELPQSGLHLEYDTAWRIEDESCLRNSPECMEAQRIRTQNRAVEEGRIMFRHWRWRGAWHVWHAAQGPSSRLRMVSACRAIMSSTAKP